MKILYVNAMTTHEGGEAYAAGLKTGYEASQAFRDGRQVEFVHYNLFYESEHSKVQPARLMGYFARQNGIKAVILSGSAKNTSDVGDPFLDEYYAGLRDLLGLRPSVSLEDWQGSETPIFGICFGHQAMACALGGETSRFEMQWGPRKIRQLPRAFSHPMLKPWLKQLPKPGLDAEMVVYHGDHVVRMPNGFHLLMTSKYCEVQGMAHDQWPIVCVQAHPEATADLKKDREDADYWDPLTDAQLNCAEGWSLLARFIDWSVGLKV